MKHTFYFCPYCNNRLFPHNKPFVVCDKCNRRSINGNFTELAFSDRAPLFGRDLWEESDRRLRNPQYALELKLAGFKVPDRYITDEIRPIVEEQERQNKNDYDNLIKAQKQYKIGKLMLKYGRRNKEVIENADIMKMSVDDFLELCKKWVDDYDELHRQYNLKHYPPADYPQDL